MGEIRKGNWIFVTWLRPDCTNADYLKCIHKRFQVINVVDEMIKCKIDFMPGTYGLFYYDEVKLISNNKVI